jgi:hypothetical protein
MGGSVPCDNRIDVLANGAAADVLLAGEFVAVKRFSIFVVKRFSIRDLA